MSTFCDNERPLWRLSAQAFALALGLGLSARGKDDGAAAAGERRRRRRLPAEGRVCLRTRHADMTCPDDYPTRTWPRRSSGSGWAFSLPAPSAGLPIGTGACATHSLSPSQNGSTARAWSSASPRIKAPQTASGQGPRQEPSTPQPMKADASAAGRRIHALLAPGSNWATRRQCGTPPKHE